MVDQTSAVELYQDGIRKAVTRQLPVGELIGLSGILKAAKQSGLEAELYKVWIAYNPDDVWLYVAYFNYGIALKENGDANGCINVFRDCLRIKPDFHGCHINLGRALEDVGQVEAAVREWMKMLERLTLVNGEVLSHKLIALQQIGRTLKIARQDGPAEDAFRQCLEVNPRQPEVIHQWIALRQAQCKWPVVSGTQYAPRETLIAEIHPLSAINLTDDPLFHLGCAYRFNKTIVGIPPMTRDPASFEAYERADPKRLRIGYVSSDLREHAVGFAMTDLIETHDRAHFEIYSYYCGIPREDATRARIRDASDHWLDIASMGAQDVADRIRADGIDILIDLNGCTMNARTEIFAMRPAPIAVNWFGFPCTMGTPYHHYLVADRIVIPEASRKYVSETVLYLDCYQPNDRKRVAASQRPTRADQGLPETGFVFCCLNGLQKLTALTFDRWMTILRGVPGSVLWLLTGTDDTNERLRQRAESLHVARDRLIFAERASNPDHLARYPLADLFLDNLPYGAHTTAADAMWMGVPILTLPGRSFGSRVCASLVRAAGISEMICESPDDYVTRAIGFGNHPETLRSIKAQLMAGRDTCLLFDTPHLVTDLEALYQQMWAAFEADALPVPDLTNLDLYQEVGAELDHETVELLRDDAYHDLYKTKMAMRHHVYPIAADSRIWTPPRRQR